MYFKQRLLFGKPFFATFALFTKKKVLPKKVARFTPQRNRPDRLTDLCSYTRRHVHALFPDLRQTCFAFAVVFFRLATTAEARLAAILRCKPGWQTVTTETDTTATARGNKRKTCANVVQIRQWRLFGNRTRCLICATMPRNVLLSLQLFKPGTLFD